MSDSQNDPAVEWHDEIAERFDAGYGRSPAFMERHNVWRALINRSLAGGDKVLDAGCGSGVFSFLAAEKAGHVDAIDGSANMITIARREMARHGCTNIAFSQAMLADLAAYPGNQYDLIMSSSVLEYVDDYHLIIAEFSRLLRPGGRLLLSMPNADAIYRKAEAMAFKVTGRPRYYAHVHNVVTASALAQRLASVGIAVSATHYFAEPPLPALLNRLIPGARRRKTLFLVEARRQS